MTLKLEGLGPSCGAIQALEFTAAMVAFRVADTVFVHDNDEVW
jgi:hypothetical protein